jgi:hypothetical protein
MKMHKREEKLPELDAKCFNKKQPAFAITNRGEVIPCCWLDTKVQREEEDYQKLLAVSHLDDYDSVDEIFLTEEWVNFFENLSKGKGFTICHHVCKKRTVDQHKKEIYYDSKTGDKVFERST